MKKLTLYLMPLLTLLLVSSCSNFRAEKEVVTVEKIIKPTIALATKPNPVIMKNADVIVITENNLDEVIQKVNDVWKHNNYPLGISDEHAIAWLKDNPEVYAVMKNQLRNGVAPKKEQNKEIDTSDTCYACGQKIDNSQAKELMKGLDKDLCETVIKLDALKEELVYAKDAVESYEDELDKYRKNKRAITKFEDLSQVIDESIPVEYPNFGDIESQIENLRAIISTQTKERQNALTHNQDVGIHNAKVDALMEQKEDFLSRQKVVENDIISVSDRVNNLEILKKAFSTSGIVAFKLENLTKELEVTINRYLSLLSDGQFQVSFRLDKEKLNIIVSNNGIDTPIETVSGGEFSRIQTAILLAIRNLLSKLGGSSVNLLFLDEITGVLDDEGKEKLIEVLSEEEELNVFLISHDFTHPLIDKISITKENNISSIQ